MRTVEPQLTDEGVTCDGLGPDHPGADENAERYRQIECGSFLSDIRRREVDRYPSRRHGEPGVEQRRADALAALLHGARRQPDRRPIRQPVRDVHLDSDVVGLDAEYGGGADRGEHA